jgi:hypothetical protein
VVKNVYYSPRQSVFLKKFLDKFGGTREERGRGKTERWRGRGEKGRPKEG